MKYFFPMLVVLNVIAVAFDLANPHPFGSLGWRAAGNGLLLIWALVGTYYHWRFWLKMELIRLINKVL